MRKTLGATLVAVAVAVAGAAIAPTALAAGGTTIKISADKTRLKFNVSSLTAKAGKVTIVMDNPAVLPHNIAIKGNGVDVKGKVVGKGGVSTVSATLKAGKYRFYCSVPGHEAAGQFGTLTVIKARTTTLRISADKSALKFNVAKLSAGAGKVTIVMENPAVLSHNVAIKGKGVDVKGKVVGKGGVSTVSATLKAGEYRFYCSVPGHEAGGMVGTLTVK